MCVRVCVRERERGRLCGEMGSFFDVFDRDTQAPQVESIKFNVVKRERQKKKHLSLDATYSFLMQPHMELQLS